MGLLQGREPRVAVEALEGPLTEASPASRSLWGVAVLVVVEVVEVAVEKVAMARARRGVQVARVALGVQEAQRFGLTQFAA